jgi:hypothetical protein
VRSTELVGQANIQVSMVLQVPSLHINFLKFHVMEISRVSGVTRAIILETGLPLFITEVSRDVFTIVLVLLLIDSRSL